MKTIVGLYDNMDEAQAAVNDLVQAVVPIEALSSNRAITTDEA